MKKTGRASPLLGTCGPSVPRPAFLPSTLGGMSQPKSPSLPISALLLFPSGTFVPRQIGWHGKPAKANFLPDKKASSLPGRKSRWIGPSLPSLPGNSIKSLFRRHWQVLRMLLRGGTAGRERGTGPDWQMEQLRACPRVSQGTVCWPWLARCGAG